MTTNAVLTHKIWGDGAGDPVLLMNGGLMTFLAWGTVAAALERTRRVIGFDFRGMLRSPGTPHRALDGHVGDVIALLDYLAVTRVHAVGTSFGALIGAMLAARHPARVRSLALITATERINTDVWQAAQPMREACRAALNGGDGGVLLDLMMAGTFSPEYLEAQAEAIAVRRHQIAAMPRAWFEGLDVLLGSLHNVDLRPVLGFIACPTLVVGAELDLTFPPEHSRALAAGIPGARLEIVKGSGHGLVAEQPERVLELLEPFFPVSS
jgi:pimeloyl-ACP methyl ester carboxylesterase